APPAGFPDWSSSGPATIYDRSISESAAAAWVVSGQTLPGPQVPWPYRAWPDCRAGKDASPAPSDPLRTKCKHAADLSPRLRSGGRLLFPTVRAELSPAAWLPLESPHPTWPRISSPTPSGPSSGALAFAERRRLLRRVALCAWIRL